jgi:hypothetical protein
VDLGPSIHILDHGTGPDEAGRLPCFQTFAFGNDN